MQNFTYKLSIVSLIFIIVDKSLSISYLATLKKQRVICDFVESQLKKIERKGQPFLFYKYYRYDIVNDEVKELKYVNHSLTNVNFLNIQCELIETSAFTYNDIEKNISDLYDFYQQNLNTSNESETSVNLKSKIHVNSSCDAVLLSFRNCDFQMLPNGFDQTFTSRITQLEIINCKLTVLDKQNLKQFGYILKSINFSNNFLTFIDKDLFKFSRNILRLDFSGNPLLHIADFVQNIKIYLTDEDGCENLFANIECVKKADTDFMFKSSLSVSLCKDFYATYCSNPSKIIDFNDLQSNLQIPKKEIKVECYAETKGLNTDIKTVARCALTSVTPRTVIHRENVRFYDYLDDDNIKISTFMPQFSIANNTLIIESAPHNYSNEYIKYIPEGLINIIDEKITVLNIVSNQLLAIKGDDLKYLTDLEFCDFFENKIQVVHKNAFKTNSHLTKVNLASNPLKYIDPELVIVTSVSLFRITNGFLDICHSTYTLASKM